MAPGKPLPIVDPGGSGQSPPVFDKVGIVGLGLIGGSVALAARRAWPSVMVIAVDETAVLEEAMRRHAVDVAADDPVVLAEADLVILAAPVSRNVVLLDVVADQVRGDAVVTDVGSTKRAIVEAARSLPARLRFVGGHPLAGATRGGLAHARADLFTRRPWLLTPDGDGGEEALSRLRAFVSGLGATPRAISAVDHDRLVAALMQLPQLVATALMHVVGERVGHEGLRLAGRDLRDTTRLASSPGGPWRDVWGTNADEIGAALDALTAALQGMRADLEQGDRPAIAFDSANRWREVLEAVGAGRTERD